MTARPATDRIADFAIVGGGFYGCALALFLRSVTPDIVLVEARQRLLDRASRVNQARLHGGFHYPRSMLTALKSRMLCARFAADFPDAVVSGFDMLYAVARQRSLVSANRFQRMFGNMGAPISPARPSEVALFDDTLVEGVFRCTEHAFDHSVLRDGLERRLDASGIELRLGTRVETVEDRTDADHVVVHLDKGDPIRARQVFNVTYAGVNRLLMASSLPPAALKHEAAEICIVDPPDALAGYGVTVMDGPFFSIMPFPAEHAYSLSHVRYTPRSSWLDGEADPATRLAEVRAASRFGHMVRDAARYMPALRETRHRRSMVEVKTVLQKNEVDDGRPILVHVAPAGSRVTSILGGKIDNIYDLFQHVQRSDPRFASADTRCLLAEPGGAHATVG